MSMSMSKSKSSAHHMSADAEDRFQEDLEGGDVGDIDDMETELGLKILKIESKLAAAAALGAGKANTPVINMLTKKLTTYNAAMLFLDENAKAAVMIGSQGGLKAVIAYITKQAIEDSARAETRKYSNLIIPVLPGFKLTRALDGGLVGAAARGNAVQN